MSNYTKTVDFAAKDALGSGNPAKKVLGTELNTEFANIATAVATKADSTGTPTLSGSNTFSNANTISGILTLGSTTAQLILNNGSAGTDLKNTILRQLSTGVFRVDSATDASPSTAVTSLFSATRTTSAWTALTFGNATDNPTYTFAGSGAITGVGSGLTALNASNVSSGTLALANGGTGSGTASGARTNLGVTATGADTAYAFRSNNLSDLANAGTARTNLGLTSVATSNANALETRNISGKSGTTKTLSTSAASGGSDGDIWYRY